jgi:flavin-dependent dehydrogenase
MKQEWDDLLQRPHVVEALGAGFELEDRHTAWPIPAGIDRATLTAGRVCFVGDAAMATDTMTGEGIGQAC